MEDIVIALVLDASHCAAAVWYWMWPQRSHQLCTVCKMIVRWLEYNIVVLAESFGHSVFNSFWRVFEMGEESLGLAHKWNQKLFMVTFSFAEGPLAWALIVWRCSLVFSSVDKLVSVLIHLLPGVVFFTICWWDPAYFEAVHPEGSARGVSWRYAESKSFLCKWLFTVPLIAYVLWQVLYFLIVNVLRRQRLLKDPEVMTSYRGLSRKARKANNIWWRLSGMLGDQNRLFMYILLQAVFTVATTAMTVPIFLSYELHLGFQILKVSAAVWNGGQFLLEVMPRQVVLKEKKKLEVTSPSQDLSQEN